MSESCDRNAFLGEIVSDLAPRSLLEIGCGGGKLAQIILTKSPSVRYTGIDRSPFAIARCRQRMGGGNDSSALRLIQGDFRALSPDAPYDICCAVNVNAFWTDPDEAFRSARTLVASRGTLALAFETPNVARAELAAGRLEAFADNPFTLERRVSASARLFAMIFRPRIHPHASRSSSGNP